MLSLFTKLAGPIFAKEMIEVSRRKRYYVNRVLYGAALWVAVAMAWQSNAYLLNDAHGRIQTMGRVAADIFAAVASVQFGAVFLLAPLFAAGLIAGEREANSLELLFTTPLRDREIVLGKLLSRLSIITLLVLCGVPVLNLILLFGGVDPAALLRTLAATLLGMFYAGSVTIYFSTISKSATAALVRSYWWMAVWMLGVPIMTVMLVTALRIGPNDPGAFLVFAQVFINPLGVLIVGLSPEVHREFSQWMGEWFYPFTLLPTLAFSGLLLWRSVARLRMAPSGFARLGSRWQPLAAANRWRRARGQRLDELRRQAAEAWLGWIPVRNPLWLRARWTAVYDREGHIARVQKLGWLAAAGFLVMIPLVNRRWRGDEIAELLKAWVIAFGFAGVVVWILTRCGPTRRLGHRLGPWLLVAAAVLPVALYPKAWSDNEVALVFLIPAWTGIYLLTVVLAATSLVGDRKRGFLELVLISPLAPSEILGGSILAVAQHLKLAYALAAVLTLWFVLSGAVAPLTAAGAFFIGLLFGLALLVLGVICSLATERAPTALIPTFIFGCAVCIGLPMLAGSLERLFVPLLISAVLAGTPICCLLAQRHRSPAAIGGLFLFAFLGLVLLACLVSMGVLTGYYQNRWDWPIAFGMNPFGVIIMLHDDYELKRAGYGNGAGLVACYGMAVLTLLLLIWRWTIRNFDRLAGRTGQYALAQSAAAHGTAAKQPTAAMIPAAPIDEPLSTAAASGDLPIEPTTAETG